MPRRRKASAPRFAPAATITLAIVLTLLWVALSGARDWAFGVAAIAAALIVSQALAPLPAMHISPAGLVRFVAFFIHGSMLGGADVARRALSPRMPLEVHAHWHAFAVPPGPPRAVLIGVISLLPGTLSVRLQGSALLVHSIAGDSGATIREVEQRVAGLFGLESRVHERGSGRDG